MDPFRALGRNILSLGMKNTGEIRSARRIEDKEEAARIRYCEIKR